MAVDVDQAPLYCFSCVEDGRLLYVNEPLLRRLGYSRDELADVGTDVLFTLATRIFQQTHFYPLLKMQEHAEEIFISLRAKSGEDVPVLVNAVLREHNGARSIIYAGIEVRNRKEFERELIAAKKAAEKALHENTALQHARQELQAHTEILDQQMLVARRQHQELIQFNKVVSHDLQEPLRKLSVFAHMMLDEGDPGQQKAIAERLLVVSADMRSVVSGLQQYVWLTETGMHVRTLDIMGILAEVQERLKQEFPSVSLVLERGTLPPVRGDEAQMRMLLYELLSNVIRFRKEGDTAYARLSACQLQLNTFRHLEGKYKYGPFIKLELADEGIGFDNEYGAQLFELFRHLHPQSGKGIGLALCRKIVHNHQGEISIEGQVGTGTTVSVLLPEG